jgi:hypothetical protein
MLMGQLPEQAIDRQREALSSRPQEHPDRAASCSSLANSLKTRYQRTGDDALLDEAIVLEREVLALHSPGHPRLFASCSNLAFSLKMRYDHAGDDRLLDEAIILEREALALCPQGHPGRASTCNNLANSLGTCYERTGDDTFLDEAIVLEREVLGLCPQNHPGRVAPCNNLAISLKTRYQRTGDDALLDDAITLEREALALCPREHTSRAICCNSLAISLGLRYQRTGDDTLLDEATVLEREAHALRPRGHPSYATSCSNLATSLTTRYQRTRGDTRLLDEAIHLEREALALRPQGHADRAASCSSLANSLETLCQQTGDNALLDEVIALEREALALRPRGHPGHALSCGSLIRTLGMRYQITRNDHFLHEILILTQEAQAYATVHTVWRYPCGLSWLYLRQGSSFYNIKKAIECLSLSLEYDLDDVSQGVPLFLHRMNDIWNDSTEDTNPELTNIYRRIIGLLPLLANSTLDVQPQLMALKGCSRIGSDAFISAALAGKSMLGLELLELAQGVIWSQSLYLRDPQLKDVPDAVAEQLKIHLQALGVRSITEAHSQALGFAHTSQDLRHKHSFRAYALVREIRLLPGLERFMRGEPFETLCSTAANHPVVVLVGARGRYYALIIASIQPDRHKLLSLDLTDEDLKSLSYTPSPGGARRGAIDADDVQLQVERLQLNKSARSYSGPFDGQLRTLWHKVVKPVLDCLDLKVSERNCFLKAVY